MRCFVIGNGPSLARTNLDKITGEPSFACNNIHLIYGQTKWRPTHYVRAEQSGFKIDVNYWQESIDVHLKLGCEMWCNHVFKAGGTDLTPCNHYNKHFNNPDCPHLWHLPMLCTFGSSVNVAVQIAVKLGYSPIYLVGCDLGYENNKPSHFDPKYEHGQEQDAFYANGDTLAAHMIAARSGHPIYNATLGGLLEAFPRVEYESLFQ